MFTEIPMILGSHKGLMRKIREKNGEVEIIIKNFQRLRFLSIRMKINTIKEKKKKKTKNGCTSERIHIIYYLTNLLLLGQEKEFL